MPLQGNIDPALLAAPWPVLEAHVRDVLASGARAPGARAQPRPRRAAGHRPDVLTRIVELVHALR